MFRLDHVAYRTASRQKTADFFIKAFGYKVQAEFEIFFNDEKTDKAICVALEPPERISGDFPWTWVGAIGDLKQIYHAPLEIFVSSGTEGSIVGNWVAERNGVGGIHHMAYQVDSVDAIMKVWLEKGWGEFTSEKPMTCDGLKQVFTKVHPLTGVVYEFIERQERGFCEGNVKDLMISSVEKVNLDRRIP